MLKLQAFFEISYIFESFLAGAQLLAKIFGFFDHGTPARAQAF